MATYVYGGWNNPSGYVFRFRSWFAYTTSSTDTTYSVTVFAGPQLRLADTTGAVGMTLTCKLTGTGQTARSAKKKFSTSSDDSSGRMTFLSSKKWTWTKGTSSASKTITCSLSGNGVSSSCSKAFTVPALASYAITYNANSGSGSGSQTKYYGKSITLLNGSTFSRSGYTLKGWNTSADGSGTTYELGATYTANKALTLYAQWSTDYAITNVKTLRVNEEQQPLQRSEYLDISFEYDTLSTTGVSYSITVDGNEVESGTLSDAQGMIQHFTTDETYSTDEAHTVVINVGGITKTVIVPISVRPIDILGTGEDISMGIMAPANPDVPLTLTPKCFIDDAGRITVQDHSSPVGTLLTGSAEQSVATGTTFVDIVSISLPAGSWVITGNISCPSSGSANRISIRFQDSTSGTSYTSSRQIMHTSNTSASAVGTTLVIPLTDTHTITVQGWQASGSKITITGYIRAMRIA